VEEAEAEGIGEEGMKEEEQHRHAREVLELVKKYSGDSAMKKFQITMTTLTWILAEMPEEYDVIIDGLEKKLKELVKSTRKM
jgi:hypothetical protein